MALSCALVPASGFFYFIIFLSTLTWAKICQLLLGCFVAWVFMWLVTHAMDNCDRQAQSASYQKYLREKHAGFGGPSPVAAAPEPAPRVPLCAIPLVFIGFVLVSILFHVILSSFTAYLCRNGNCIQTPSRSRRMY